MMIAKNDEEKRSKIWRIVTLTATIVIIAVAVFFIIKLFTSNPLEGTWKAEDNDLTLTIKGGSTASAQWQDLLEANSVKIKLRYSIDKDAKMMTLQADEANLERIADKSDGKFTKEKLESAISSLTTTFDYSVDQRKLTLTEREYGEQMVFTKK